MGSEICFYCKKNTVVQTKVFTLPDKEYSKTISISHSHMGEISLFSTYNVST